MGQGGSRPARVQDRQSPRGHGDGDRELGGSTPRLRGQQWRRARVSRDPSRTRPGPRQPCGARGVQAGGWAALPPHPCHQRPGYAHNSSRRRHWVCCGCRHSRRRRAAGDIRLRHLEAGAAISVEEPASASERVRVGRGVQLHHRVRRRIGRSVARLGRAQQTSGGRDAGCDETYRFRRAVRASRGNYCCCNSGSGASASGCMWPFMRARVVF
mmetsp:Transcript_348/g.733  ORF Transcript_348/g.733 Transcript_348/m.733 type:complete len:213 (-) Transcript_348:819-1457(-)